jgi:5,10-methylene-tetrahydrofolate dehydrogenase/methenyl tetrahydrofolate cyclohydrolase
MGMHASSQSMNATVTICHSRTKDIASHCRRGDIIVAALGKAEFVRGDWLKPGCVVIDVGINSKPDSTKKSGYKLVGDVNFDEAVEVSRDIGELQRVPHAAGFCLCGVFPGLGLCMFQLRRSGDVVS